MKHRAWRDPAIVAAIAVVTALYLWDIASDFHPALRGPQEWQWHYAQDHAASRPWLPLYGFLMIALLVLLLEWDQRLNLRLSPAREALGLAWLVLSGCALLLLLIYAEKKTPDWMLARVLSGSNSFYQAATEITNLPETLRHYPEYIRDTQHSHIPSHPPGNLLFFWLLNRAMADAPLVAEGVLRIGQDWVQGVPMLLGLPNANRYNLAGALASMPLIVLLGRLTAVPVYGLGLTFGGSSLGVRAAALTLLVPGLVLFAPIFDTVYPLFGVLAVFLFLRALEDDSIGYAGWSALAFSAATFMSVGCFVLAVMGAALVLQRMLYRERWLRPCVAFALTFALTWLVLDVALGVDMIAIFRRIGQYQLGYEASRSYWLWLRWKPYDFTMFLGLPVTALALLYGAGVVGRLRLAARHWIALDALFLAWVATILFLDVTGVIRAEVGRLMALLMPFGAVFAVAALDTGNQTPARYRLGLAVYLVVAALECAQLMVFNRYLELV